MGKVHCHKCKKSCKGEALRLEDKYFHVKCFKCKECSKQLATGGFYSKNGEFFCQDDYQRMFGTRCHSCSQYVEGEVFTALGNTYHQHCLQCSVCRTKFAPGDKVTFNGKEYVCKRCLGSSPASPINNVDDIKRLEFVKPVTTSTPLRRPVNDASPQSETSDGSLAYNNGQANNHQEELLSPQTSQFQYGHSPSDDSMASDKKSQNSLGQQGRKSANFGRFYTRSYLKPDGSTGDILASSNRGPVSPKSPLSPRPLHFHRPEGEFSYNNWRREFYRPIKKADAPSKPPRRVPSRPSMDNEEVLQMAKLPDAHLRGNMPRPIERPDWPGPPSIAAAFPELLTSSHHKRRIEAKSDGELNDIYMTRKPDEKKKKKKQKAASATLR